MSVALHVRRNALILGENARPGELSLPEGARGLVIFAHGSGSSRSSPRNTFVADSLHRRGFGTLLFDLLSETEAADRHNIFDVPMLASRVVDALVWAGEDARVRHLPVGLFGASTGAAAALVAASQTPDVVAAVVSRGGRPDLASGALERVRAPVLLIVGGNDVPVLALNREALAHLCGRKLLAVVPGATHLFDEPGTLEAVVDLAADWFEMHLVP